MDIKTKTIEATIEDAGGTDEGPGEFTVALTTPDLDREGDELHGDEWELPLPGQITFVNDHTHKVNSIVGSAIPVLEGENIVCRGTYATTANGQDTRKLVKGKHLTHVSVAYREKRGPSGRPIRELINGSFVVVPANTRAMVLASKAFGDDNELSEDAKLFIKSVVEEAVSHVVDGAYQQPNGFVHMAIDGATEAQAKSVLPQGITAEVATDKEKSVLILKDAEGKTLVSHELPAPEGTTGEAAADQSADQENEAKTLAALRAKAFGFTSRHETD